MWTVIASLFTKLIAPIFDALKLWWITRQARSLGRAEQRNEQHDQWNATQERVDQAVARVDGMSDAAVRDSLRQRWGGSPSTASPPVQPGHPSGGSDRR